MTLRSVIIGLCCVAFISGYTYFNDNVMRQTMFIGNSMPISVYGFLVIFLLFIFPLFKRINRRLLLKKNEIAIILVMTLVACAVPGSNLMRFFTSSLIMPNHYVNTEPGWQQEEVLSLVPDGMIVDPEPDEETILKGFTSGLSDGNERIAFSEVPWRAWLKPICFWTPIILSLWVALIGLSLVVHRQWKDHEHLPYPIVTFTKSLLPQNNGERNTTFNNRIFWIGLMAVFGIHLYNYLNTWFPDIMLGKVPLGIDFSSIGELFPTFAKGHGATRLQEGTLIFTVAAIAYFLPTDVSFSLGIGPLIWAYIAGSLATYGIATTGWQSGWPFGITLDSTVNLGAYTGLFLVLMYTGHHYYSSVFKKALLLPSKDTPEKSAIWGARVFIISMVIFVMYAAYVANIGWPIAALLGFFMVAFYMVMGRVIAETGLFFIKMIGTPATIIWAIFGSRALGPEVMLVMFMFCLILFYDAREALMPYVLNSFKMADDYKVHLGKVGVLAVVAIIIALAIAIPATLYFQYDTGAGIGSWHVEQAKQPFNDVIGTIQRLDAQGQLETAGTKTGLAWFADITPHKQGLTFFGVMLGIVVGMSFLRLRFVKWPIHPVMFLVWNNYSGQQFWKSFLAGWFIKVCITKYGGANIYQKVKPLMFGLIAGEMLGGIVPMIVSLIYYLMTDGTVPKTFSIMPN